MFNKVQDFLCKRNNRWIIKEYVVILLLTVPIYMISLYALPCSDDFATAIGAKDKLIIGKTYFQLAVEQVQVYYKSMGGYFFSVFLNFFLSPYVRWGMWGIRVFILVVNIFFHLSLYVLIKTALDLFFEKVKKEQCLFVYILILFTFTNMEVHSETLTWYTGMVAYVLVIICMFWGIIFFLKGIRTDKKIWFMISSLIGFLVSGGALNVATLNCGIYLIIGLLAWLHYLRRKEAVICFCGSLLGAIINVAAPGNYLRHGGSVEGSQIASAFKMASYHVWESMQYLFFETPYILYQAPIRFADYALTFL